MRSGPRRLPPSRQHIPDHKNAPESSDNHQPSTDGGAKPTEEVCEDTPRMDKVEQVKKAIESGDYHVPSSDVATKIIDQLRRK